ncbi:MAG: polyamine aminopropyltransferase [Bacteroidota bacterium]
MIETEELQHTKESTISKSPILLVSVFVIAICGILYELLISTISSYFQGSSILHFSIIIGLFLSFMGVGSYLSRFFKKDLLAWFIRFELILGIMGGLSTFILYLAFSLTPYYYAVVFLLIGILGAIIGLEIPILTRIIRKYEDLRNAVSNVLSFDYLGALIASLLFPLVLLPIFGTMKTAFLIGMLNVSVAIMNSWQFREELPNYRQLFAISWLAQFLLLIGLIFSFQLVSLFEKNLYQDPVLYSQQTPYQKLVITRMKDDVRLFINGSIQFSSKDEYRYHEALVHVPMILSQNREHVLILGGGDGLVAREVLKYSDVQKVTLVDLDQQMTDLGMNHPIIQRLNEGSLLNPKVEIVNTDAYKYLENSTDFFSVVIVDLPDPHDTALGKLYSQSFYNIIEKRMGVGGTIVTQSTSPYHAPKVFWSIHATLGSVFNQHFPYRTYVPAFGEWGFNLGIKSSDTFDSNKIGDSLPQKIAKLQDYISNNDSSFNLRYLTPGLVPSLFEFDKDTKKRDVEINRLDNQILIQYYDQSLSNWK